MSSEITRRDDATLPAVAELSETAREYARASKSDNTRRAYAGQIRLWVAYAEGANVAAFPADPAHVANWLAERAKAGQAYATLRTSIAAVRAGHVTQGMAFDSRHPAIETVMRGIGRVEARAQKQAEPIRGSDVADILIGLGQSPIDLRDGALLALGYCFGLRRSELVGLDLGEQGDGDGFLTIGAREVSITLARAKTARAGEVETVTIPRAPVASAVSAVERWIAAAGIRAGEPILRRVTKGGKIGARLTDQSIRTIVKARIAEHHQRRGVPRGVAVAEAERFSAHSLRTGFAVTAAEAGSSADEIALVTRHRSLEMPRRYAAKADALRRSPYRREGVGTDRVCLQR